MEVEEESRAGEQGDAFWESSWTWFDFVSNPHSDKWGYKVSSPDVQQESTTGKKMEKEPVVLILWTIAGHYAILIIK